MNSGCPTSGGHHVDVVRVHQIGQWVTTKGLLKEGHTTPGHNVTQPFSFVIGRSDSCGRSRGPRVTAFTGRPRSSCVRVSFWGSVQAREGGDSEPKVLSVCGLQR